MTTKGQSFGEATDLFGRAVGSTNFLLDNWLVWLIVAALAWLLIKLRAQHELLGNLDERAGAAFADIDAALAERHALIPNLVEAVKAFMGQEHRVLKDVIDARARATSATGGEKLAAEAHVGASLANLWDITESYPKLESSAHFIDLRREMTAIEARLTASRRFYNMAVEEFYAEKRAFPGNLIATFVTLGSHEKFTLGENRAALAEPVRVSF